MIDEIIFQYKRQGLDASLALDIQEDGSYFIETHRPMNGYGFSFVESVSLEFIEPKIIWVDD